MSQDIIQVLVVCANGDKLGNLDETKKIVKVIDDTKKYILTSVNTDNANENIVYDHHITGTFGEQNFKLDKKYDIVIFQGCMTGLPNWFNIFDQPNTLDTLYNCLNDDGLYVNSTSSYAIGPDEFTLEQRAEETKKLKTEIEQKFNFLRVITVDLRISVFSKKSLYKKSYDVWKKKVIKCTPGKFITTYMLNK